MAELARLFGDELGVNKIGRSGGVVYNLQICESFHSYLNDFGIESLRHIEVAAGDAGIRASQIYYRASFKIKLPLDEMLQLSTLFLS